MNGESSCPHQESLGKESTGDSSKEEKSFAVSEASREKERLTVIARFKQFYDQKMSVNPRHQFVCKGWFWRKSKDRKGWFKWQCLEKHARCNHGRSVQNGEEDMKNLVAIRRGRTFQAKNGD